MLGNWITPEHRFIFIIDQLAQDRIARKVIGELLQQGGIDESTLIYQAHPVTIGDLSGYDAVLDKCSAKAPQHKWNIVLPTLSEMLMGAKPSTIFRYIQRLLGCEHVQHVLLWATESSMLSHDSAFILKCCQHMAHAVFVMDSKDTLTVSIRRRFGKAASKAFQCVRTATKFEVLVAATPTNTDDGDNASVARAAAPVEEIKFGGGGDGTFKIDLEEDEVVARNALKLPYERTAEPEKGKVVYTPDANDDMDDSDPDEEDT